MDLLSKEKSLNSIAKCNFKIKFAALQMVQAEAVSKLIQEMWCYNVMVKTLEFPTKIQIWAEYAAWRYEKSLPFERESHFRL